MIQMTMNYPLKQKKLTMHSAYFLLRLDDYDPMPIDMQSYAEELESLTELSCEDYIFFNDDDQVYPYIAI